MTILAGGSRRTPKPSLQTPAVGSSRGARPRAAGAGEEGTGQPAEEACALPSAGPRHRASASAAAAAWSAGLPLDPFTAPGAVKPVPRVWAMSVRQPCNNSDWPMGDPAQFSFMPPAYFCGDWAGALSSDWPAASDADTDVPLAPGLWHLPSDDADTDDSAPSSAAAPSRGAGVGERWAARRARPVGGPKAAPMPASLRRALILWQPSSAGEPAAEAAATTTTRTVREEFEERRRQSEMRRDPEAATSSTVRAPPGLALPQPPPAVGASGRVASGDDASGAGAGAACARSARGTGEGEAAADGSAAAPAGARQGAAPLPELPIRYEKRPRKPAHEARNSTLAALSLEVPWRC
mmetsp:Transcript_124159/g.397372  ORF Transcript_124159/g.397372 Transcript_124159/m.397372 type:complete len:352 (-) Transcript_124159:245-1300(-)